MSVKFNLIIEKKTYNTHVPVCFVTLITEAEVLYFIPNRGHIQAGEDSPVHNETGLDWIFSD